MLLALGKRTAAVEKANKGSSSAHYDGGIISFAIRICTSLAASDLCRRIT